MARGKVGRERSLQFIRLVNGWLGGDIVGAQLSTDILAICTDK